MLWSVLQNTIFGLFKSQRGVLLRQCLPDQPSRSVRTETKAKFSTADNAFPIVI